MVLAIYVADRVRLMDRDEAERSELEEIRRAWERGRPFRGNVRTIIIDGRVCHMPNDDD